MVWHPIVVKSSEHFEKAVEEAGEKPVIVYFWSADDREHRTREDVMFALKRNAFGEGSMEGRFGEIVQLEVNADKFPSVLDLFDISVTPSLLAIRQGQVVDENVGLAVEDRLLIPLYTQRGSTLPPQVKHFYSQNVPGSSDDPLVYSSSDPRQTLEGTHSRTSLSSERPHGGLLRVEDPADPPPSYSSPHTPTQTTLSAKEEKSMLEAAANTTTEDAPEYSLTSHLIASLATNEEDGQGPTPATDEVDGSLLRLLRLSAQEQDAPSATSRIGSED